MCTERKTSSSEDNLVIFSKAMALSHSLCGSVAATRQRTPPNVQLMSIRHSCHNIVSVERRRVEKLTKFKMQN